jgi:16S rRNA (guanine966-N2)-methyltransferase
MTVHRGDAIRFIEKLDAGAYDVAFADPPYGHHLARAVADRWHQVPFARLLGIEHGAKEEVPAGDTRKYGSTAITIYTFVPRP